MVEYPYTNKPEDVPRLLQYLSTNEAPVKTVGADVIKAWGFSPGSSKHLLKILKILGFLDDKDEPSTLWLNYVTDERRGLILASAIKKAYARLFEISLCPYLEEDE
jgi:hypothetical protein